MSEAGSVDPAGAAADNVRMALSGRNQDIYKALLSSIAGDIKSNPRLREFRKPTKEPMKLPGMAKLTVPAAVWELLTNDATLTDDWDVALEEGGGTCPEFTMTKR